MHVVIVIILESLYISLLRNKGVIKVMGIRRCGLKKMEDFSINILSNNVKMKRLTLIDPTSSLAKDLNNFKTDRARRPPNFQQGSFLTEFYILFCLVFHAL